MHGESNEHWIKLCIQASSEQDPDELIRLIREINDLLEENKKHRRDAPHGRGSNMKMDLLITS